jgi:hypothetical protein
LKRGKSFAAAKLAAERSDNPSKRRIVCNLGQRVLQQKHEAMTFSWLTTSYKNATLLDNPLINIVSLKVSSRMAKRLKRVEMSLNSPARRIPMSLPIFGSTFTPKSIVLVDMRYPYGKKHIYMNGSLCAAAARLVAMGNKVTLLDFNIDDPRDPEILSQIRDADLVGITVTGSPHIPGAISFAKEFANQIVMVGGQTVAKLEREQFETLFQGTSAVQIASDVDLAKVLGCNPLEIPPVYKSSLIPVWMGVHPRRLRMYLQNEFSLFVSQGCAYQCDFCGAEKQQKEKFVDEDIFLANLTFLANEAKRGKIKKLEMYASSLDFFQNPEKVARHLDILARVRAETGIDIRVRCLSCMKSFLRAYDSIPDLPNLLKRAGLWCIGFGVDGTDEEVWRSQHKRQNDMHEVVRCLDICHRIGIRSELLMVMGFPQDTAKSLFQDVVSSVRFVRRWSTVVTRPYLAKAFIPGNKGWATEAAVQNVVANPRLFYNLDFCAIGSRLTHPRRIHRWMSNAAYLAMIALLTPTGHCTTSPLLPQGSMGRLARMINRLMPFDR